MSEEIKNQQAAEPEALTETEINEQMQVEFWRLTPARAPGWALNAQKGQQMGVKCQNGCHSGRLTPERWGDQDFVFKSNFFKLSFSYPYFST